MKFKREIREALARMDMPQIPQATLPEIYDRLCEIGVQCECGVVECSKLSSVQEGINREKVDSMKQDLEAGKSLGHIVISNEGYIMDGHHRWVAMKETYGDQKKIQAVKINLPKDKSLKVLKAMSNEKRINEAVSMTPVKLYVTYEFLDNGQPSVNEVFQNEKDAIRRAEQTGSDGVFEIKTSMPRRPRQ